MELLYADYRDSVARRRWFVVLTILALSAFTLYTLFGLGEWKDEIYSKGYSDGIAFQKTVDENKGTLNGSNTDTPSRTTGNNGSTAGKTSSGGTPRPKDNQFPEGVIYIGNKNTKKYHETTCSYLPDEENMVYIYSVAQTAGYTPCGRCKP